MSSRHWWSFVTESIRCNIDICLNSIKNEAFKIDLRYYVLNTPANNWAHWNYKSMFAIQQFLFIWFALVTCIRNQVLSTNLLDIYCIFIAHAYLFGICILIAYAYLIWKNAKLVKHMVVKKRNFIAPNSFSCKRKIHLIVKKHICFSACTVCKMHREKCFLLYINYKFWSLIRKKDCFYYLIKYSHLKASISESNL